MPPKGGLRRKDGGGAKKEGVADFVKKAQKVGKRKLAPSSETRIDVKLAKLEVQRDEVAEGEADDSLNGASLADALSHTRHHSVVMRRKALTVIRGLLEADAGLVQSSGTDVVVALAGRLLDPEPSVRALALPVLSALFRQLPADAEAAPSLALLLSPFLTSALTKLHTSMRLDALGLAGDIVDGCPPMARLLVEAAPGLLPAVISLLEPTLHAGGSALSVLHSIAEPALALGGPAGAGAGAGAAACAFVCRHS